MNILTADEFVRLYLMDHIYINQLEDGEIEEISAAMIEFAKQHAKAALEEASQEKYVTIIETGHGTKVDTSKIFTAYPEDKIR